MGIYREHVLPRLVDRACGTGELRRWRAQIAAGLSGTVVELGFGSGLNMAAYPPEVTLVYAVEPAEVAGSRAVEVLHVGTQAAADGVDVVVHVVLDRGEEIVDAVEGVREQYRRAHAEQDRDRAEHRADDRP